MQLKGKGGEGGEGGDKVLCVGRCRIEDLPARDTPTAADLADTADTAAPSRRARLHRRCATTPPPAPPLWATIPVRAPGIARHLLG
jgi:hypothetical protein